MSPKLIVNADDYGLTEAVSAGILRAHREGIVTSTSVLALAPAFAPTVPWLADHPDLGVGVHLALVGEDRPLLSPKEIPTLVDRDGRLAPSWRQLLPRLARRRVDPDDVRREVTAQLEAVTAAGIRPTHVDTHQHLHLWPSVRDVILDVARTVGVPAVRLPRSHRRRPVGVGVNLLARRLATRAAGAGIACPDDGAGVDHAGHLDAAQLDRTLRRLARTGQGVVELGVHPGEADDPDRARYRWDYDWPGELDALIGERAHRAVAEHGFELVSYAALSSA